MMTEANPEILKSILKHLENHQETDAERQLLISFLRGLFPLLDRLPHSAQLPEAFRSLQAEDRDGKQQLQELERQLDEQESLRKVSLTLASSLDLKQVLRTILIETFHLIENINDAHIFLYSNDQLVFGAVRWANGNETKPFGEPRQDGLTYTVARSGEKILVPDMQFHPLFKGTGWTGSIIGMPLKVGNKVVGVMTTSRHAEGEFTVDELRLLQLLADHAAIAIENARLHDLVEQQAHVDPLTGLYNRRALNERLEAEIARYQSSEKITGGPDQPNPCSPFSLLMMDLDGFKKVNDTYGHLAGDRVLKELTLVVSQALRKTDFLSRFGGDELALLLSDTDLEVARSIAGRIQDLIANVHFHFSRPDPVTLSISIGIALYPRDAASVDGLIDAADQALYQAKNQGDNMIAVAAPLSSANIPA